MIGLCCATSALALAAAPGARAFEVVAADSRVGYAIAHTLHDVRGESRAVEGRLLLLPDGKAQAMVRIPAASFRSGDANRDAHLMEVIEGATYPHVVLKAVGPASLPERGVAALTLKAQLEFHGQKRELTVPVEVGPLPDGRWRVSSRFTISLDAFAVERPSLMFVKLPDETVIRVELVLREVPG